MLFEDPNCQLCPLFAEANHPCLQGSGRRDSAKLAIFCDNPLYMDDVRGRAHMSDGGLLLQALLKRMSLNLETDVRLDYIVKCYPGKAMPSKKRDRLAIIEACSNYRFATLQSMPNLAACVGMGRLCLEAFNGSTEIGKFEGESWWPHEALVKARLHHVWYTYSPHYLIEKPAETPGVYRILWTAAVEAGLKPVDNPEAFDFVWPS